MIILRKHILKEWFRFFLGSLLVLILLLTIANLISGMLRSSVSFMEVLFNHFIELPGFASRILPIACLIASLFSINKLKMRNELAAIFAAGFSRQNFILTLVLASSIAASFQFLLSGYVYPLAKSKKDFFIEDPEDKFGNLKSQGLMSSTIKSGKLWYKSQNYFISFSSYNKNEAKLHGVTIYKLNSKKHIVEKLSAKELHYKDNKWLVKNASISPQLDKEKFIERSSINDQEYPLQIDIKEFDQADADITTLDLNELGEYIEHLQESGINTSEYQVLYWDRYSSALVCIAFALLASIGIFTPNRRNSSFGRTVGGVLVFTLVYWFVYSYISEAGKTSRINPIFACFVVPTLFFAILGKIFYKHRQLN